MHGTMNIKKQIWMNWTQKGTSQSTDSTFSETSEQTQNGAECKKCMTSATVTKYPHANLKKIICQITGT